MTMYPPRREIRSRALLAHVLHLLEPHLKDGAVREVSRELGDLFFVSGAYIVTDADRANAGLQPRDHNGLTLDELVILERVEIANMLRPLFPAGAEEARMIFVNTDGQLDVDATVRANEGERK